MEIKVDTDRCSDGSKLHGVFITRDTEIVYLPCRDYKSAVTLAHQLTRLINEHTLEVCEFK